MNLKIVVFVILIMLVGAGYFGLQRYQSKRSAAPTPSAPGEPAAEIMTQERLIEKLSKEKLAQHLDLEESQIEIVKTEKVDWPDASLGAPEEGMMYAQVITPGYKITMMTGSVLYEAHTDEQGKQVVLVKEGERLKP